MVVDGWIAFHHHDASGFASRRSARAENASPLVSSEKSENGTFIRLVERFKSIQDWTPTHIATNITVTWHCTSTSSSLQLASITPRDDTMVLRRAVAPLMVLILMIGVVRSFQFALPVDMSNQQEHKQEETAPNSHIRPSYQHRSLTGFYVAYYDNAQPVAGPSLIEYVLGILLVAAALILCIFLPLCYPLSLWDLVSVYCHWEECDTQASGGDYAIHACDIMVC